MQPLLEIGWAGAAGGLVYEAAAQRFRSVRARPRRRPRARARLTSPPRGPRLGARGGDGWTGWDRRARPSAREGAAGFAKRHNVAVEDLEERDGFLGVVSQRQSLSEVLPGQLDELIRGLRFGKTMRWDESGRRFPRPIRWTAPASTTSR